MSYLPIHHQLSLHIHAVSLLLLPLKWGSLFLAMSTTVNCSTMYCLTEVYPRSIAVRRKYYNLHCDLPHVETNLENHNSLLKWSLYHMMECNLNPQPMMRTIIDMITFGQWNDTYPGKCCWFSVWNEQEKELRSIFSLSFFVDCPIAVDPQGRATLEIFSFSMKTVKRRQYSALREPPENTIKRFLWKQEDIAQKVWGYSGIIIVLEGEGGGNPQIKNTKIPPWGRRRHCTKYINEIS